jgi:hypothetical protein
MSGQREGVFPVKAERGKGRGSGGGGLPLGENGVAARLTECSRLIRTII